MAAFRGLQRLQPALARQASCSSRSLAAVDERTPLVKMENPFTEPRTGCTLCKVTVDYKNTQLLSQFISPHTGRIYGRHITSLCGRKQKEVSKAIKKAHSMGFMSVTHKHPQFMRDPNVCGVKQLSKTRTI